MTDVGPPTLHLRPLTGGDSFLLRRWIAEPHVIRWWGTRAAAEAALAFAASSDLAIARIVMLADQPIGYAHALDIEDARSPPGTLHADVFIGPAAHRGHGHGGQALRLLRDELFHTTLATALAARVPVAWEREVRTVERAGFRWDHVEQDPTRGPCWVLLAQR